MPVHQKIYCESCDEIIDSGYVIRFDEYHKPQQQLIKVIKYCPICGAELKPFKGWKDDRKNWW